jgi:uncharacterized protein YjbI with pentapeptide repeats
LRVDHRLLVDHVWDNKAIVELQYGGKTKDAEREKALASLEGLVLRDRSLRFAALDESALLAADLRGSDLTKASLNKAALLKITASGVELAGADLIEANLDSAQLQGADLSSAHLQGSNLVNANLNGANLSSVLLIGANLAKAQLQNADLGSATLDDANLSMADLGGAQLSEAQLRYADLRYAQLQGAIMANANLQAATLSSAELNAADLHGAKLQGADIRSAQLQGTDLRRAFLNRIVSGQVSEQKTTNLGFSDLRDAKFVQQLTDDEMKALWTLLFEMPAGERKNQAIEQYDRLSAAEGSRTLLYFTANPKQQLLVSDPADPIFKKIPTEWLIGNPTPAYRSSFVKLLADNFASASTAVATGIAQRVATALESGNAEDRVLYAAVACRLAVNARAQDIVLEPQKVQQLESECEHAQTAGR